MGIIHQMKTVRRKPEFVQNGEPIPELHNGDRLSQPEFHRRYLATPEDFKAELIGGTVYVTSPVKRNHGTNHPKLSLVLTIYEGGTPGTEVADNMTAILDEEAEPQPDLMLRLLTEYGGQSYYDESDYLVGAPELTAEIAHSSVAIDMNKKKDDYFRSGVQEYIVYCTNEKQIHWFHFPSRRLLRPDQDGIWRSKVFPGLWLNGPALIERDTTELKETIERGLASSEHTRFVQKLQRQRRD